MVASMGLHPRCGTQRSFNSDAQLHGFNSGGAQRENTTRCCRIYGTRGREPRCPRGCRTAAPSRLKGGVSASALRRLRHPRCEDAMESNSVRRSLGIAGALALGSIVFGCAQQQTASPASGTSTPPAATASVAPVTGNSAKCGAAATGVPNYCACAPFYARTGSARPTPSCSEQKPFWVNSSTENSAQPTNVEK